MDKRLEKRHKRQVERSKMKVKVSEPDVRTHEEIEAARDASRADSSRAGNVKLSASPGSFRNSAASSKGSAAKTDG
ncbi:MAG: hypothetical protein WKF37_15795 [Bryobacteraceae bacterium]|jgi:hypothetical protein